MGVEMSTTLLNLDRFPRIGLAHLPTPLEPMERLSQSLGGPRLWVKRDDCTGLATGGNKARKLEFLMADALAQGADTVITQGAVQSNHARQTAAAAAKLGMQCHILLEERLQGAPQAYHASGNVFLDRLLGAELERRPANSDMGAAMLEAADRIRAADSRPYIIPGGGSNRIGALGYVACIRETLEQARQIGLEIHHIVHATGSSGTQAGLVAGMIALGAGIPIHGVSVRFDEKTQRDKVLSLAGEVADEIGAGPVSTDAVLVYDSYVGPGYGQPTAEMIEAIRTLARTEGLLLDPVYSGKAMAGLLDLVHQGMFGERENVLFLHTGGAAALSAYEWAFEAAGVREIESASVI